MNRLRPLTIDAFFYGFGARKEGGLRHGFGARREGGLRHGFGRWSFRRYGSSDGVTTASIGRTSAPPPSSTTTTTTTASSATPWPGRREVSTCAWFRTSSKSLRGEKGTNFSRCTKETRSLHLERPHAHLVVHFYDNAKLERRNICEVTMEMEQQTPTCLQHGGYARECRPVRGREKEPIETRWAWVIKLIKRCSGLWDHFIKPF